MKSSRVALSLLAIVAAATGCVPIPPIVEPGQIAVSGRVEASPAGTAPSGGVAGASVVVTCRGRALDYGRGGREATTNSDGRFSFQTAPLLDRDCNIWAFKDGFADSGATRLGFLCPAGTKDCRAVDARLTLDPYHAPPAVPPTTTRVVLITTSRKVTLEHRLAIPRPAKLFSDPVEWERVCTAPCGIQVLLDVDYRIAGDGVTPSPAFRLHGLVNEIHVRPGSTTPQTIGYLVLGIGVDAMIVGVAGFYAVVMGNTTRLVEGLTLGGFFGGLVTASLAGVVLGVSETQITFGPRTGDQDWDARRKWE